MKIILFTAATLVMLSSCKKDKFTTEPQIKFEKLSPNSFYSGALITDAGSAPQLTLKVTDQEGDIGFVNDTTRSYVYIKNLNTNKIDSFDFPSLGQYTAKRLEANVTVNLFKILSCNELGAPRPRIDTTYFQVYVTDFAKNKSNMISTPEPVYFLCQ